MDEGEAATARLHEIADDPRYRDLLRRRGSISWGLSILVMIIFFGYMLLVAFARSFLGQPIAGMTMTIGIPIGIGVILSTIILTAGYVAYANRRFDADIAALLQDGPQ